MPWSYDRRWQEGILKKILSFLLLYICVELDHFKPSRGWRRTAEVVLDGIGEDISLALAVLLGVLLRTKHDGL